MDENQLDMFGQEPAADFIARWCLLDSPSPHRATGRLCYGLVSHRLSWLKRHGRNVEAAQLAEAGAIRVCAGDAHWTKIYPYPSQEFHE